MEIVISILAFALMMVLAFMFYERSRRSEAARERLLMERIRGRFTAPILRGPAEPAPRAPARPEAQQGELLRSVHRWLTQGGIETSALNFIGIAAAIGGGTTLLLSLWLQVSVALLYGIAFASLPFVYAALQRRRRLRTFSQQLPYVLDFIRSALRAGHTLLRALQMSSENAPEPIATEIRLALDQMRLGASLPDALESMFKRVPEESLGFFVAAVRVQTDVGSGIAEILDRVSEAIRDRQRLQQQLLTLTAQARMSGHIVGALPVVLLLLFTVIRPEYTAPLFHDPVGIKMLEVAAILEVLAFLIIRRMVSVD
jgi:tight adherence protein B